MKIYRAKISFFIIYGLLCGLNCQTNSPTKFDDGQAARIKLNVVFPNIQSVSKSFTSSAISPVDLVTVTVVGFNDLQEQTFFYVEDQPLAIDQVNNVASGVISFELGQGDTVIQNIDGVDVIGEEVDVGVDMFENGQLLFTGFTSEFFVAPDLLVETPPIMMQSPMTNGNGEVVGTIEVSSNPALVFSQVDFFVDIAPNFVNQVTRVTAIFDTSRGFPEIFRNLGAGVFEETIVLNNLGILNFEVTAFDSLAFEVGRGVSFIHTFVDLDFTGLATNVDIQGDFDIAFGDACGDGCEEIAWPLANPAILADTLRFQDLGQNVTLWEIAGSAAPFGPNVEYLFVPAGAQQIFPTDNERPPDPIEGARYRITIEAVQGGNGVSSQMDFTFTPEEFLPPPR